MAGHAMAEDVTIWLDRFLTGNQDAWQLLWDRYFAAMLRLASRKLGDHPRRAVDEEDVAISAFQSFCRAAQAGRFPNLRGRDELWQLLVTITRQGNGPIAASVRAEARLGPGARGVDLCCTKQRRGIFGESRHGGGSRCPTRA